MALDDCRRNFAEVGGLYSISRGAFHDKSNTAPHFFSTSINDRLKLKMPRVNRSANAIADVENFGIASHRSIHSGASVFFWNANAGLISQRTIGRFS